MPGRPDIQKVNRRRVLTGLAAGAASLAATRAFAQAQSEDPLQQLIQQNQRGGLGESFDSTSRTIAMPKASLPTLSPANVPTTEAAIARYEKIASAGGWPQVPPAERLRTGVRNPGVPALRQRLTLSGDLDPSAVENDIYDSYVEAAVKRFQARHGISADGRLGALTIKALNIPVEQRLGQLKTNLARLRALDTKGASRFVVCNIPGRAARGDRERHGDVAPHRGRRQAGPSVARVEQQDRRDQLQPVLDRAGLDRAQGPDPEDAGRAGLSHALRHPHFRPEEQRARRPRR